VSGAPVHSGGDDAADGGGQITDGHAALRRENGKSVAHRAVDLDRGIGHHGSTQSGGSAASAGPLADPDPTRVTITDAG
jgi:hypothetical protein